MHPKWLCRSVVAPTPNLLEQQYALRLIIVPCWYLPIPFPSFQTISLSPLSHISSIALPNLPHRHIHPCCPASLPPCSSTAFFTSDLVYHPYYTASPPRLHFHPPVSLLRSSLHYLSSFRVICCRCLSTFSNHILSLLCVILYYTVWSNLLHNIFITLRYYLITTFFFSLLERLFSLSMMFSLSFDLIRFSPLAFTPFFSNLIIPLSFIFSDLLVSSLIFSTLIALFMLWYDCSDVPR